ncbi:MAG: DNA topoisomerase III [Lachnospiraceae bacterium]|nr:DNA topoisomerase III [Lachnospiraceae bacterium]
MKSLVIAEKPSVGRDIARVLGCKRGQKGYLEGKDYIVTWALGHLVELSDPESYGDQWKEWKIESLPMLPEHLKTQVIKKTGHQYQVVKTQLHRKDVGQIIIATDAGREGELVARWIIDQSGVKKPMKRLWISSVTDKAIREGFQNLKDAREYDHLYEAAVARAEADWLVGLNATRALTCKHNAQLSCGRVQTPTLAMIARRAEQIRRFQPREYYGYVMQGLGISFHWKSEQGGTTTFSKEEIQKVERDTAPGAAVITHIKKKAKKSYPPQLYDLTSLQQEANQKYGFSAKETLNYMQSLYERHKVVTYPRTDSRYLTSDLVDTLKERVKACQSGEYAGVCTKLLKKPLEGRLPFVDNSKVSDHHAIIPTEQGIRMNELEYGERKIYELVVRRFLAALLPPCEYEETEVWAECGGQTFMAKGTHMISLGFRELEQEESQEEKKLPSLEEGRKFTLTGGKITQGKTKPPLPFTEATLLAAMEHPANYMENQDKDLAKTLGETGGLGTVATRADIIEKLFGSFMMEKKEQYIHLTAKGRQVLELAPSGLTTPELTARWEQQLVEIAQGREKKKDFEAQIRSYTSEIVKDIIASSKTYKHENLTGKKCPQCGKLMLEVNHKNGRMLVCQDRECGYRKHLSRVTNARCPQCHKKMELVGEGENKRFICSCGYREKMASFEKRKQESGGGVSKKDVARYMNQQKKEAEQPLNNAFADAFAKLKL